MKAVVHTRYGSPDLLELRDMEEPVPNDNEVLIRIHATTVNRTDCGYLRGKPFIVRFFSGLRNPKHPILGNEFAGKIVTIGKDVSTFNVGDDVFGYNDVVSGAHAEYKTMREDDMITTMPADMTYEEAAPTAEGAHYALKDIRAANVQSGHRVLVHGATGAIGSAAVQLVKHIGAEVTAVCDTANMDLVRSLGADRIIDYTQEDFTRSGGEYDFVFDAVGKSSFGACKKLLKPCGIYCSTDLGFMAQNPLLALWTS